MSTALKAGRWLGDLLRGRKRTLHDVRGPTRVLIRGTVLEGQRVASPVTPVRAIALTAALIGREIVQVNTNQYVHDQLFPEYKTVDRVFEAISFYRGIDLETQWGRVHIPASDPELTYAKPLSHDPVPLPAIPEVFRAAHQRMPANHEAVYSERYLIPGDVVRLRATVQAAAQRAGSSPYRSFERSDADFVVVPERERPQLVEA